jgi:hypothetical protein
LLIHKMPLLHRALLSSGGRSPRVIYAADLQLVEAVQ